VPSLIYGRETNPSEKTPFGLSGDSPIDPLKLGHRKTGYLSDSLRPTPFYAP
jgi:hypothetical protein